MATTAAIQKSRRNRPKPALFFIVCLFALVLTARAQAQNSSEPDLTLTILHTNDLHAHDEPFVDRGQNVGGMTRIGHLIRAIRKNTPNVLTIDAGDIFQGTPFFKFYHGAVEVGLLNLIGYDIYTPGNHEFDEGPDNLAKQLQQAKFDIISANMDASGVPELGKLVKPSVVKTINGRKVGFVGAICPDLEQVSLNCGKVRIKDTGENWMKPIRQEVEKLKSEGVTRIILVTHIGLELDKDLAEAIPEVDAIIGGHSHTRLDRPVMVRHTDGSQTAIVQTGSYGKALGKLKLVFDQEGRLIPAILDYHLININNRIYEDTDIKAYIAERAGPVLELRNKTVGYALGDFDNRFRDYPWDSALGDLICDALADRGTKYGATITFENRGGIRGRIERGPVTMEKIEEVLPFDNHVTFSTVPGKTILNVLEHSTEKGLGGRFFDVHGLKVAYDPSKPPGSKIIFAMAQDERGRWHDIDPAGRYKIAVNDYNFNSGEGYEFAGATNSDATKERLASVLADYLTKVKKVSPVRPSRIVPITDHLLTLQKHGAKRLLQAQTGIPRAHLTLVTGSWPGVDTVGGSLPVPLHNARIAVSDAIADESGEYSWELPLKLRSPVYQRNEKKEDSSESAPHKWAALIVQPQARGKAGQTKISYPVQINQETQTTRAGDL